MLGGFLGGLANLGTAYGGYLGAQSQYLQNQLQQQRLQDALAQQDLATFAIRNPQAFDPRTTAQPGTATPGATPTPGPLQPLTTAPVTPVQAQPLPALPSPLQQAAAGPFMQGGFPGGGPFGLPSMPGQSAFGGGLPPSQQPPQITGLGNLGAGSPFGPSIGAGGPGTLPTVGAPQQQASLTGVPGAREGLGQYEPLPDYTIPQVDTRAAYTPTTPPDMQGPATGADVFTGVSTLGQPQRAGYTPITSPQLQGLGGGGIVQPSGGFGLPPQYTPTPPQTPAAPQTADAGTAAVPGTADRGLPAQLPADDTRAQIAAGQGGYRQILQIESGGNMNIGPGSYGEIGPAQILPSTAKPYMQPGENLYDPSTNIKIGQRYYDDLLNKSGGDYAATLVGYNRGEQAMRRFQQAGDNLDALRGTGMMPTAAYQRAIRAAGGRGGGDSAEVINAHGEMSRDLSPAQHGIGDRGLQMILARMPQIPQAVQMMKPSELAQLIQQSFPGTSDAVKGAVFLKALPLMNEIAKEQTAQAWDGWKAQMEQLGFIQKEEDIAEQRAERRQEFKIRQQDLETYRAQTAEKGGQVWRDPESGQSYWVVGGRVQPLEGLPSTAVRPGTAGAASAQESLKLYEKLEADKLRGDEAAVKQDQQAIDDWNRAQGKGISGRQSQVMAARQGILKQHPEWADGMHEDEIQDQLGEYKRLQSIDTGFGSGVLGRNVVSLNTVAAHAQTVRQAFEDLDTGNVQRFNQIAQRIAVETGQEAPTDFATAYSIMSGEVVRLLTTTGGTEGDRNHFQSLLQAQFSKAQGRGSLRIFDEMIDARFKSLEQQYSSVGGPEQQEARRQRFRNQILSDDARALHSRAAKAAEKVKELTTPGGDTTKPALEVSPEEYENLPSGSGYRVPGDPTVRFKP